jgi:hypothetical protein
MTLVGIPMIFVLISVFEISRGMWIYHTLSYAVREATRYAVVHGHNCYVSPNNCPITVADVARRLENAGVGLIPAELNANIGGISCNPLSSCFANTTAFPQANAYQQGQPVTVSATYLFRSAISMFWPGAGPGMVFAPVTFGAASTETIQF